MSKFFALFKAVTDIKECNPSDAATVCDADECCIAEYEFYKVGKRDTLDMDDVWKLGPVYPYGRAGEF